MANVNKIESIEIIKFVAAILITNSHFDIMYAAFPSLATGGAIGNALFFFCSGFTLMLSGSVNYRFDEFLKKRINRIYPSVITWTLIGSLLFDKEQNYHSWGGWFVPCIMCFYLVLFMFNKFLHERSTYWLLISIIVFICWFYSEHTALNNIYIFDTKLAWGGYFFSFWMGAYTSVNMRRKSVQNHVLMNTIGLFVSTISYFAVNYLIKNYNLYNVQWIVFIPISILPLFAYRVLSSKKFIRLYYSSYWGTTIRFIGALCLEIFLVQIPIISDVLNFLFPLNLVIIFLCIIIIAYLIRSIGRLAVQTFNKEKGYSYSDAFNWI